MKININYDFFSAVQDANEKFGTLKIIRNNRFIYFGFIPSMMVTKVSIGIPIYWAILSAVDTAMLCYIISSIDNYLFKKREQIPVDFYAYHALTRLAVLRIQLNDINVNLDGEALLAAKLYSERYHVVVNEHKIPMLQHDKFILVKGTTNYSKEEKEISILQEHIVGTEDYTLSVGEPEKKYKRVLVKSGANV